MRPTRDHITPTSRGGKNTSDNVIIVCQKCNNDKKDWTLFEFILALAHAKDRRQSYVRDVIDSLDIPVGNRTFRVPVRPEVSRQHDLNEPRSLEKFQMIGRYLKVRKSRGRRRDGEIVNEAARAIAVLDARATK